MDIKKNNLVNINTSLYIIKMKYNNNNFGNENIANRSYICICIFFASIYIHICLCIEM